MALNIKNERVQADVAELARLRRVSLTQAVGDAVRSEIERERGSRRKPGLAAELLEIGRRCADHIHTPTTSSDHADLLYDELGLPR